MTMTRHTLTLAALTAVAVGIGPGCGTKIDIVQYPPFYDGKIQTVAVLPMANESSHAEAGALITEALITQLRWNGAYQIVTPVRLDAMLRRHGLRIEVDAAPMTIARTLRQLGTIDAFVLGSVELYHTHAEYYGGQRSHWKYSAATTATMEMLRVADGERIYATDSAVWGRADSVGDPPSKSYAQLKTEAVDQLVGRLTKRIAPTHQTVAIDRDTALRTAGDIRGGAYAFTTSFTTTSPALLAVVNLPPAADGNTFRLRVVRKNDIVELAGGDLLWQSDHGPSHLRFEPGRIARRGGGPGRYQVQLMSGGKPAVSVDIKIAAGDP